MDYLNKEKTMGEMKSIVLCAIQSGVVEDLEDLHFSCFNVDYNVIGYYESEKWIKENFGSVFGAIDEVISYENDMYGESNTCIKAESIANMLYYIAGEEFISTLPKVETVEELESYLNN